MKRDEKMMGSMFPRIHMNEREIGGRRGPPRNKMALYEQLSIPSQRFNSGSNDNHDTSSTQGNQNNRPMFSPLHRTQSTQLVDNSLANPSDSHTSLAAPQKKLDEEDFAVPVFAHPENCQDLNISNTIDQEKNAPQNSSLSRQVHINHSSRNQNTPNKKPKQTSDTFTDLRQKDGPVNDQEDRELLISNDRDRLRSTNNASHHKVNVSNRGYYKDKTECSLAIQNGDRCDDGSDTSMLDSVSVVDISPDDVVGLIGQKNFWKARREIVNQQRVFAVQVFELHRLIKVQRLFAGSPNLLLEDAAYLGKPRKASIPKELSLEFIIKSSTNTEKSKEDQLNNPSEKAEASAEIAVEKSSLSSSQNISQHLPSNQIPFPSNPQPTPVASDPTANPWCFNQPTGQHWLVPFMSPTEGLIYKPYHGPGDTGSNPMMNSFPNPSYGYPNHHPYFPHGFPPMSHTYFSPYGSAVDQQNHFMGTNFGAQQESSCNDIIQLNNNNNTPTDPRFVKTLMGNESGVQVSTASSPGEERPGFQLFPNSPGDDVAAENQTRAIKVVPHNAVSANESAFRIFQSIQKDRDQYEGSE